MATTTASTSGVVHRGVRLCTALGHAYRAAFDNPELIVACGVGDGEAGRTPVAPMQVEVRAYRLEQATVLEPLLAEVRR